MNLKRLEGFLAVYKHGNLTGAAYELGITKSAVSQSLALFEKEIKRPLFIRESRTLIPTRVADNLFTQISPLMDSISQILGAISEDSSELIGTLRFGVPPDFAATYVIPCLAEFQKQHPHVRCLLKLGTPLSTGPLLLKNELDFAIIDATDAYEKLYPISGQLLSLERHVLVCSKSYMKDRKIKDHSYEALCEEHFIAYTEDAIEIRFWFKHHFKKTPRKIDVSLVVDQIHATKSAVLNGFGFGHVPERIVEKEIKSGEVLVWPTKTPKYENRISIAQLAGKKPTKVEKSLLQFITKYFDDNGLNRI